jgi:hypothetical protein
MGVARFDGHDLDDYGVKSLRRPGNYGQRPNFTGLILLKLIQNRRPDVLILLSKEVTDTQEGLRQSIAAENIQKLAAKQNIPVVEIEREATRKHVTGRSNATGRELSDVLKAIYPELVRYTQFKDRSKVAYYQPVFAAVAGGLTHIHTHEQEQRAR